MATLRHTRYQVAIMDHDCLLLIRFASATTTFWLLPGGGREPDESENDCLIREAWEELGVRIVVEGLILHQQDQPDQTYQAFKTYRCRIIEGTPQPGYETINPNDPSAGIVEVGWVDLTAPETWPALIVNNLYTFKLLQQLRQSLGYV
ncbi:MAG TPA: NUDIX hydrolase [Herpetosiphon sp.]|uniref:NUDIX hydrolase n=1 Tax=Herpetosiphon aurantiacus (strain ATCC 23779 / DSM 785 / 114-95) TaxID=316274 RepID=A9B214_HERA2|nr:NUDIX hydrolase [Herpetosiphon sp.]ABX07364.1 NUDIX hydrolase [Herpetosiphon aurantiacus DSM 785]HBW48435.1 NUDIX hydrolase [Herpetosiphon sp.]